MEITGMLYLEVCLTHIGQIPPYFHIPLLHVDIFTEDNTIFRNRYNLWGD